MILKGVYSRPIAFFVTLVFFALALVPMVDGAVEYVERDYLVETLPQSVGQGFEPHILAGPGKDGTEWLYVDTPTGLGSSDGQGGNLWISKDHGVTWEWYDKDMAIGTGRSGDSYTAISEEGNIYYTDLYLTTASVDFSLDGGNTWIQNPQASQYLVVDRQWLQLGPDGNGGEILYFSFNQLTSGLVMVKSQLLGDGAFDWIPCNGGVPITTDVGSRDNMVVDQNNGNIYHANYQSDGIYCYISTDQGDSFYGVQVNEESVHAKVQNTFMDIDVDSAGNIYMIWSSRDHIFMAVSQDEGLSWVTHQVTEKDGCRVLPWIASGDEGRVALAWFDTNDTGNPNNLDDSVWDYYIATTSDATSEDPTFQFVNLDPGAHVGSVRTSGTDGDEGPAPDRDLGDYIGLDVDELGRVLTVWGPDRDDGVGARANPCMFARQNEGPFMKENIGPMAEFSMSADGLEVELDGSLSADLGGEEIVNYEWFLGDGTTFSNVTSVSHEYDDEGTYEITLLVTNAQGLKIRKVMSVSVEENSGFSAALAGSIGAFIILLIIGIVLFFFRRNIEEDDTSASDYSTEADGYGDQDPSDPGDGMETADESNGEGEVSWKITGDDDEEGPPG